MKLYLIIVLLLASVTLSFGQKPSSPSTERAKNFGSSLKKYEKKKQKKDSQTILRSNESVDDETIRIKTDLVVSDVLVTDQKSNVINNLKKEDFIVLEDGAPQAIEIFSPGEKTTIPRSVILIIDCLAPQRPYLKNSINAAKILVDKLNPKDKMAIVTVDLKLQLDFTQDKTLLKKTLDFLEKKDEGIWGGWEFNTLLAVLNEMFDEKDRQKIIIFQGDGSEVIWLKSDKDSPYPVSYSTLVGSGLKYTDNKYLPKFGFSDVKEAIEKSGATIYSVIPGVRFLGFSEKEQLARAKTSITDSNKFYGLNFSITVEQQYTEVQRKAAGQTAMFKVAELSGGNAGFIEKPESAENIYSDIFTVIKNRYVIGYYPTNQSQDGNRRNIKIEVRNHPEYVVTGRKAYFAIEAGK